MSQINDETYPGVGSNQRSSDQKSSAIPLDTAIGAMKQGQFIFNVLKCSDPVIYLVITVE